MTAYWQPELLKDFKPADKSFAREPKELSSCIRKAHETVETFLNSSRPLALQISAVQTYLLGNLQNVSLVGTYSTFWEQSLYVNGYSHPETIRLAYL